ncbi:hypothetical protein V493_04134 [Pseudogymnoascus sp. VKM F-4281 (FW-2241)]|nr:hypothetical protein V493_04134 [Pseudogymnoascus sp. VKM F-4281 (FW-2241)]
MARKKLPSAPPPANSGFKASASYLIGRGTRSSQAANAKPVAMNEEAHTEFLPVYIHTAKCDICEKRNDSVLQRCMTCTSQFCHRCMVGGDGIHVKSNDMDWTDYGAQANSTSKTQRNGYEYTTKYGPVSLLRQRYIPATEIPSCRSHQRELKNAREKTTMPFVADDIPTKAGPAPTGQGFATDMQPNSGIPATVTRKSTRLENVKRNDTDSHFPLIIPSHEDDYGPKFQRFLSNVRDMGDHDMTEEDSPSSDNDDHSPIPESFSGPFGVLGRNRNSKRVFPNPWAKEIKEHKHEITDELSLIDRTLDILNDRKRQTLVMEEHIDEVLDAACILMSMRAHATGFLAEKEASTQRTPGKGKQKM